MTNSPDTMSASQPEASLNAEAPNRELVELAQSLGMTQEQFDGVLDWVKVLLQRSLTCPEEHRGISIVTPWGGMRNPNVVPDKEKHDAFVTNFLRVLSDAIPWMVPVLNRAGAVLVVGPGSAGFAFGDPDTPPQSYRMPQLDHLTLLASHETSRPLH